MERTPVLWIADSLAADAGTERQVVELSRWIRQRYQLHIATFEAHEPRVVDRGIPFEGFPLQAIWTPRGLRQLSRLASFIREKKIQVVHGFMPKSSLAAAMAGTMGGAPVILGSRRNLGYHYNGRTMMLTRLLNRFTTRIVANSQAAKQAAVELEGICADKVDVVYNGVDLEKFYPAGLEPAETAIPIPSGARVVGIVANYRPVKNLALFLRSAALVAQRFPDVRFLLVGSGTMEADLRSLAENLGIADRVIFTSGQGEVLPWLHRMCIGCLCSSSEGFSNSILEYMAVGLPVVATDVGGNGEAIQEGQTGFLVKDATPEAFARPLLRLLEDESLRSRMGVQGLERCREEFELSQAARRLGQYYEWLLGRPSGYDENVATAVVRNPDSFA